MSSSRPKRVKDTDEMVAGVHRQIKALTNRGADEDPWAAQELLNIAAAAEAAAVKLIARYREVGYSWTDIGFSLGMTGAAACKKYAPKVAAITTPAAQTA